MAPVCVRKVNVAELVLWRENGVEETQTTVFIY